MISTCFSAARLVIPTLCALQASTFSILRYVWQRWNVGALRFRECHSSRQVAWRSESGWRCMEAPVEVVAGESTGALLLFVHDAILHAQMRHGVHFDE
jgi:hypothetical protein